MIFPIGVLVSFVVMFAIDWSEWEELGGALLAGFIGALVSLLGSFVLWIAAVVFLPSHDVSTRFDLVSLRDAAGVEGSFFIGTGGFDSTLTDTWYQRESDGSYTGHKIDTDNARIFQDSPTTPYLVKFHGDINWGWARALFPVPSNLANKSRVYEFHIPKDSIKSGFVLDGGK